MNKIKSIFQQTIVKSKINMLDVKLLGTAQYETYVLFLLKKLINQLKKKNNLNIEQFITKGHSIIKRINPNKEDVLTYNESNLNLTKSEYIEILKTYPEFLISYLDDVDFFSLNAEDFDKELYLLNRKVNENINDVQDNVVNNFVKAESKSFNINNTFQTILNDTSVNNLFKEISEIDEETKKNLIELTKAWWIKNEKPYDKLTLIYLGGVFFRLEIISVDVENRPNMLKAWSEIMNISFYDNIRIMDITYCSTKSAKNSTLKHLGRVMLFFKEINFQIGIRFLEFIKSEINKLST